MTKRIFRSIFLVAIAVLLACFALFFGVLYNYFSNEQEEQLKTQLIFASEGVEAGGMDYLQGLEAKDCRLTWVAADGTVIFDNESDPAKMQNHSDREEIKEAMEKGYGKSSRYSSTLTQRALNIAQLLKDGTVLRISISSMTTISLVFSMLTPIFVVLVIALILSAVIASGLSKKIVKPLEAINYDKPLENNIYEEMAPILTRMENHHNLIKCQQAELDERKKEFMAVISNMNEGLVLLNNEGEILSINPAAEHFLTLGRRSEGRKIDAVEDNAEILEAIRSTKETGSCEISVSRNGREYLLHISCADESTSIVILIVDVTDRIFAERNRREFTANVSHELKTPLQTIMGSAELLENNLVKQEDVPVFINRIRSEASRLVTLIEDIIRLSQLDEKSELPFEDIELLELVSNEILSLKENADKMHISLSIAGEPVHMNGVRQLLHEIVYNLCENAIKYNVEGGSVLVTVGKTFVSVKDTGIGIEAKHQGRIFERFYRVDKSHSRNIGGTGLGLSIVKHAVDYMKGTSTIESSPGAGTAIIAKFPDIC